MRRKNLIVIGLILGVTLALRIFNIPIASSQGPTLVATHVSDALPATDPAAALWQKATPLEAPLSAQQVTAPALPQTNVKAVTARALYNDSQLAILVEWSDPTKNDEMVRIQDFRDAVAVQFPIGDQPLFVCMGQVDGNVNIWHWKADWQKDLTGWQDIQTIYPNMNVDQYPFARVAMPAPSDYADPNYVPAFAAKNLFALPRKSPVENLVAGGFGTLTSQPPDAQIVAGFGEWSGSKWRVIFTRDLKAAGADMKSFDPTKVTPIAFAAWDGANGERNGQKSASQWANLQFESAPAQTQTTGQPGASEPPVKRVVIPSPTPPNTAVLIGVFVILGVVTALTGLILKARGDWE
ncbi:MAG: hypothetical protein HY741_05305 [Chloroflexi bacterium]|nr:hypothetical protein [Chloroflexota bacterium]